MVKWWEMTEIEKIIPQGKQEYLTGGKPGRGMVVYRRINKTKTMMMIE